MAAERGEQRKIMPKRHKMKYPKPLGEIVRQEMESLGLYERLREAEIWRIWGAVVGETVARRAVPLRIIKGVLTVAVSSGPWMQELRYLTGMIREKLNAELGLEIVSSIVLKTGKVELFSTAPPEEIPHKKRLTARQLAYINEQSAALPDPELQKAFAELMKVCYQSQTVTPESTAGI